jgi:hypothetical protein
MLSAAPLFMPMFFYGKEHEYEYRRPEGYDQLGQTALDADHPPADEPHNEIGRGGKQLRHGETSLMGWYLFGRVNPLKKTAASFGKDASGGPVNPASNPFFAILTAHWKIIN